MIEVRRFGRPEPRIWNRSGKIGSGIEGDALCNDRTANGFAACIEYTHLQRGRGAALGLGAGIGSGDIDGEGCVRCGIDGQAIDKRFGDSFEINGPKDAGIIPVIAASLCPVDGVIHGVVIDVDLNLIFLTGRLEEAGDVVLE